MGIRLVLAASWIVGLAAVLVTQPAQAEPYFSVMAGKKCMACHVNPTGGGKRTAFGNAFGQKTLSARSADTFWDGKVMEYLAVGGDIRASAISNMVPNQEDEFEFDLEEALLFIEVPLLADRITLYLDQQFAPSSTNREAYALLHFRERTVYLKAGKFFLPHGYRLEDDTELVREITGLNMENPDEGVEAGIELGQTSFRLAVTNGTAGGSEVDTGKQFSLQGEYYRSRWRIGGNVNFNDADNAERTILGGFAGLKTGPVSWLGEINYIDDDALGPAGRKQWVSFAEANWWIRKGHNLKFTYGHFDPDDDVDEDERNRYSIVYEYFPFPFSQLRIGFRSNDGIPQNDAQNAELLFVQLHGYF